jgi:hypothetical protein
VNPHVVKSDNTLWVFLCCSTEARHLDDIILAVTILRKKQVGDAHVLLFVDHPQAQKHFGPYGIGNIYPVEELHQRLQSVAPHELAITVVEGHGGTLGLKTCNGSLVQPFGLFNAVRSIPELQAGIVLLAQCFAGIFNYADASNQPELVVMGAANLNPSVSTQFSLATPLPTLAGTPGLQQWLANLFSFDFFAWIENPQDVDGDGALTAMDAFKFAGANSNSKLRSSKLVDFVAAQQKAAAVQLARDAFLAAQASGAPDLIKREMTLNALATQLQQLIELLYLSHEPWILHARQATKITFAL